MSEVIAIERRLILRAEELVVRLRDLGQSVAVAESLTGGMLCSSIVAVPGASKCLRGGTCTYATDVKAQVLGVDSRLLAEAGPVSAEVACQMAAGAAHLFESDWALSTTGVAGPEPDDFGNLPGCAYIGLHHAKTARTTAAYVQLSQRSREQVRELVTCLALETLLDACGCR